MPYPMIAPAFFKEFTSTTDKDAAHADYIFTASPAALECVFPLNQEVIIRKLMDTKEPLQFMMTNLKPEHEEKYTKDAEELIAGHPHLKYYWPLRSLTMNILQNRRYVFEKRMLLLNFALKTVQGMMDYEDEYNRTGKIPDTAEGSAPPPPPEEIPNLIPQFVAQFSSTQDHDDVMNYFSSIKPNFAYSLCDGMSLLTVLPTNPDFDKVKYNIFKNLQMSPNLKQFKYNSGIYMPLKKAYYEDFLKDREHYIEHIMVNYVWTNCMPFADYSMSVWDNFVYFNTLFNAIKVMLTCYMKDRNDDDFVFAVKAFDIALSEAKGKNFVRCIAEANHKEGLANNGDMAILAMS
ncbi:MAG: hypothetical protein LIO69_04010 [Oscillospiraceae bacterium]|nr:hypothetical protein [Oscillospiraceae bacterium]